MVMRWDGWPHVLDTRQFKNTKLLISIFRLASRMNREKRLSCAKGKLLASLFYEPSTRTRLSFEAAMLRLGGGVLSTENAQEFSSTVKGETLEDTIRVVGSYVDVIVLRHPEEGSAIRAAGTSKVPIINAGDGSGQHPTQALLDAYTLYREFGTLQDLKVMMVGDLFYSRTVHSLTYLLAQQKGIKLFFVSPPLLAMPSDIIAYLKEKGVPYEQMTELSGLRNIDAIYVTRIQKERFRSIQDYEEVKGSYVISKEVLAQLPPHARILHPLPRAGELDPGVDNLPQASYFKQAENGLFIRMALLKAIFDKDV
jgi:aspartate carbamoyltransferase catalytic subunit